MGVVLFWSGCCDGVESSVGLVIGEPSSFTAARRRRVLEDESLEVVSVEEAAGEVE